MAKYLDYDGLGYFWNKIESKIDAGAPYEMVNLTVIDPLVKAMARVFAQYVNYK